MVTGGAPGASLEQHRASHASASMAATPTPHALGGRSGLLQPQPWSSYQASSSLSRQPSNGPHPERPLPAKGAAQVSCIFNLGIPPTTMLSIATHNGRLELHYGFT